MGFDSFLEAAGPAPEDGQASQGVCHSKNAEADMRSLSYFGKIFNKNSDPKVRKIIVIISPPGGYLHRGTCCTDSEFTQEDDENCVTHLTYPYFISMTFPPCGTR
jgi:hypothetical protein